MIAVRRLRPIPKWVIRNADKAMHQRKAALKATAGRKVGEGAAQSVVPMLRAPINAVSTVRSGEEGKGA